MEKIVTDLNAKGVSEFEAFVSKYAKDGVSCDYDVWWDSINFDNVEAQGGVHFELGGRYTKSGNPMTTIFGLDRLEFEEVED